jgi:hypothetical protein
MTTKLVLTILVSIQRFNNVVKAFQISREYLFAIFLNKHLSGKPMAQVLKPLQVGILSIIMLIGIVALTTELTEYEEVAKVVVIPSLILLIIVTGYALFKIAYSAK